MSLAHRKAYLYFRSNPSFEGMAAVVADAKTKFPTMTEEEALTAFVKQKAIEANVRCAESNVDLAASDIDAVNALKNLQFV